MCKEAFCIAGESQAGGVLIVSDHASDRVPDDIDLGIDPELLNEHVAIDIGVAGVALQLVEHRGYAAFLANVSRLVCDCNRAEDSPGVIPHASDGHAIPGNLFDIAGREERLERFYRPYHEALAALLDRAPPRLIVSLHSFTPRLASAPNEQRPWQCGILYNEDDRAARLVIPLLEAEGLKVGDQQPYSGKLLNETMNRHAEAHRRPYFGIEIRQDQIRDAAGQADWAERLLRVIPQVAAALT
ncbi:N-formylglutamate amidohydrolase [Altererythrobacter salegens]|uniref:N-formylglutamate amidohydrolase n=1 Tax=Croceibacterium salegens TaxID=1737568 RepID=A0A6I4SUD2_9SPHN|nr:N-formylglutamate amidohydrolase [Croceibacterium salegens]